MEIAYYDDRADIKRCEVKIEGDSIFVSYEGAEGYVTYSGQENEAGHYTLLCDAVKGKATLHRFKESYILEGHWIERGLKGFWRITLQN